MKALSVRQPWASLIAMGHKTLEVRSRHLRYRGPLLICASQSRSVSDHGQLAAERHGLDVRALPRGVALCVVNLVDSRPPQDGDERRACCPISADEICWVLDNPRRIEPFPVRGALMPFEVDLPAAALQQTETP